MVFIAGMIVGIVGVVIGVVGMGAVVWAAVACTVLRLAEAVDHIPEAGAGPAETEDV